VTTKSTPLRLLPRLTVSVNQCYRHVAFFELVIWLLIAALTFLSFRNSRENALGMAIGAATIAIVVALVPLVLSQTVSALFLGCIGTEITAVSVVIMAAGTTIAAAVLLGTFWLMLHTPFLAFIALGPFVSVSPILGFSPLQHWLISALTVQLFMLAFSWWRLRNHL
jgi:hypothetical protein